MTQAPELSIADSELTEGAADGTMRFAGSVST